MVSGSGDGDGLVFVFVTNYQCQTETILATDFKELTL
jgi:hypothetical protein